VGAVDKGRGAAEAASGPRAPAAVGPDANGHAQAGQSGICKGKGKGSRLLTGGLEGLRSGAVSTPPRDSSARGPRHLARIFHPDSGFLNGAVALLLVGFGLAHSKPFPEPGHRSDRL